MTELSRPIPLDRIGPQGLEVVVEAAAAELPSLAARLQLPAVGSLQCRLLLRRAGPATITAAGTLSARVTQLCVVTLDPFEQPVAESFELQFVPAGTEVDDDDPDSPDQLPYTGRMIDVGEAAVEQLALALDPYPHGPGAGQAELPADDPGGAFAALARMRRTQ